MCAEDALAAIEQIGRALARSCSASRWAAPSRSRRPRHPSVEEVLGLAPWIPDRLDLSPLQGTQARRVPRQPRPLAPGHPGREPAQLARRLRAGEGARRRGRRYTLIPGALHGIARPRARGTARAAPESPHAGRATCASRGRDLGGGLKLLPLELLRRRAP